MIRSVHQPLVASLWPLAYKSELLLANCYLLLAVATGRSVL